MTKRFIILALALFALTFSVGFANAAYTDPSSGGSGVVIPASTVVVLSYSDPTGGGQAACTWYNQGQLINGPAWSWQYDVWAYRDGYHVCWTRYGTPAWKFAPR